MEQGHEVFSLGRSPSIVRGETPGDEHGRSVSPGAPVFGVKGFWGQATMAGSQGRLSRSMALRMTSSFRMAATRATLAGLPAARRRAYTARSAGLYRTADRQAMYSPDRAPARPPAMARAPPWRPPSPATGANAARAAASSASVLASRPVARAKSRAWRGLTTTTGRPAAARAATAGASYPPVASTTTRSGAAAARRATWAAMPASSLANRAAA